jgi:hypothetical protein
MKLVQIRGISLSAPSRIQILAALPTIRSVRFLSLHIFLILTLIHLIQAVRLLPLTAARLEPFVKAHKHAAYLVLQDADKVRSIVAIFSSSRIYLAFRLLPSRHCLLQ